MEDPSVMTHDEVLHDVAETIQFLRDLPAIVSQVLETPLDRAYFDQVIGTLHDAIVDLELVLGRPTI